MIVDLLPRPSTGEAPTPSTRHYGKYRGTVSDNDDPRSQGRIKVKVPEVLVDVESGWALPCVPYAGDKTGTYAVPPVGAGVWVEFEAGDVTRPIWAGGWWASDKVPTDEGGTKATPDVKLVRSEEGLIVALHDDNKTIAISDDNGSNIVKIEVDAGTITVKAGTKVVVEAPAIELVENASHAAVFGDKLDTYLNQLVTSINTHMHPGQQAGPYPVTPMTPQPTAQTPTPDLQSTKVKVG